MATEGSD